ncbi:MAG: TPM domain-containing protein [Bacteroidales bacterium]|nr:TPM domain-containing protein [Bacteroidales bacterium]
MKAAEFFTPEGRQLIEQAIANAELDTSGEIRLHVEVAFEGDILDRAASVFARLNMHRTQQRNGVLIFFAIRNRSFAILGDIGVNGVVPENFWDETKTVMESHFRNSEFALGLAVGVKMVGDQLKKHFPHLRSDTNELVNEISFDSSEA